MFFRMFFTCALFQSIGELERFSAAAIKRPSLLLSLCQGDNLHCPLTQLPSLYFICKNKCTGGFVGFTHLTPAPLNQSFYIKPFYTNYSSGLLTCQRQIGIWNHALVSRLPFAFHENGVSELVYAGGKACLPVSTFLAVCCFHWLQSNSLSNVWLAPLEKLEQLQHNTQLYPDVYQPMLTHS